MESKAQNLYLNFTRINAMSYASQADAVFMKKAFQDNWPRHYSKKEFLQQLTELVKTGKFHAQVKALMHYVKKFPVHIMTEKFQFFLFLIVLLSHEPADRSREKKTNTNYTEN